MAAATETAPNGKPLPRIGVGAAIGHHEEMQQGVFEDRNAQLHRGLVTLPPAKLASKATFTCTVALPSPCVRTTRPRRAWLRTKSWTIRASLKDVCFESRAIFRSARLWSPSTANVVPPFALWRRPTVLSCSPSRISHLAVTAEQASDAIAFDGAIHLLRATRGVLEDFGCSLPLLLLGGFKPTGGRPIDTLHPPPERYGCTEIQQFRILSALIAHAVHYQDPICLGHAATASAWLSQRHLPKPHLERVIDIAEGAGACGGVQVTHSARCPASSSTALERTCGSAPKASRNPCKSPDSATSSSTRSTATARNGSFGRCLFPRPRDLSHVRPPLRPSARLFLLQP